MEWRRDAGPDCSNETWKNHSAEIVEDNLDRWKS